MLQNFYPKNSIQYMKQISTAKQLHLPCSWLKGLKTCRQNFDPMKPFKTVLHFSSNLNGIPYVELLFVLFLSIPNNYVKESPTFYVADIGMTNICVCAEFCETRTLKYKV